MKVLITGGSGLVGKAIQYLIDPKENDKYIFLSRKDGNLEDEIAVRKIFDLHKPTHVIHLAAYVGGLYCNMRDKVKMLETNIKINMNIINYCHLYHVEKLICCLSTCIFPDGIPCPMTEDSLHQGPPHDSNYPYAYAKRLMETQCKIYRQEYHDNFMCIIPTNIYGPHDNFSLANAHVVPSLIHKCYLARENQSNFTILGSGSPQRQFLFSYDLATILLRLLTIKYQDNLIISPPVEQEVSIKNVGETIAKNFGIEKIEFDINFADGQFQKTVSNSKLMTLFPDLKFTPLEQGIKTTVKWFRENYPNIRC